MDPVGWRQATLLLFTHRAPSAPAPPDSLTVPPIPRSNATFGDDVMPLNSGCASSGVSHCTLPVDAFRRTTVPFDVPTMTELSKTAGDEKPRATGAVQTTRPAPASRANSPCIVVTNSFPYATAGVAPISRAPVFRSQIGAMGASGARESDAPLFARSPRNSIEGSGSSRVGTGGRTANVWESNPALYRAIASPSETTRLEMPTGARSHAWPVRFHSKRPINPAGGWRLPRSKMATPKSAYQVEAIAIPFARAALRTASQVAFVAAGSETVSLAHAYVPSPRSKRMRISTAGFAKAGGERHTTSRNAAAVAAAPRAINLT